MAFHSKLHLSQTVELVFSMHEPTPMLKRSETTITEREQLRGTRYDAITGQPYTGRLPHNPNAPYYADKLRDKSERDPSRDPANLRFDMGHDGTPTVVGLVPDEDEAGESSPREMQTYGVPLTSRRLSQEGGLSAKDLGYKAHFPDGSYDDHVDPENLPLLREHRYLDRQVFRKQFPSGDSKTFEGAEAGELLREVTSKPDSDTVTLEDFNGEIDWKLVNWENTYSERPGAPTNGFHFLSLYLETGKILSHNEVDWEDEKAKLEAREQAEEDRKQAEERRRVEEEEDARNYLRIAEREKRRQLIHCSNLYPIVGDILGGSAEIEARTWCEEMGAGNLAEVEENFEEFATDLGIDEQTSQTLLEAISKKLDELSVVDEEPTHLPSASGGPLCRTSGHDSMLRRAPRRQFRWIWTFRARSNDDRISR